MRSRCTIYVVHNDKHIPTLVTISVICTNRTQTHSFDLAVWWTWPIFLRSDYSHSPQHCPDTFSRDPGTRNHINLVFREIKVASAISEIIKIGVNTQLGDRRYIIKIKSEN